MRGSSLSFVTLGALLFPVVVATGSCTGKSHLPPPPPPGGAGGVGGAGGSTGGTGGQAGGTSGAGGFGGAAQNACECLAASADKPGGNCATCINDANLNACLSHIQDCQADPGCLAIVNCVSPCGTDAACIQACVLPFESDPSHLLYFAVTDCSCDVCKAQCSPPDPIACPDPPATGGAGGSAGGGAGGAAAGGAGAGGAGGAPGGAGGSGG